MTNYCIIVMYAEFSRTECEYMNFQSAINHITMLAGGSIPGEELLSSAQIAGVTLAGLGIVFACLVLLVFVILIFGKIFEGINKKQAAKQAAAVAKSTPKTTPKPVAAPAAPAASAAPVASSNDEDEVVAVISAVIAAMSAADGTTYKVRSIKPAASGRLGARTAWGMDGRRNNVMPF
ncbi:MAG: hypothetical protein E7502_05935 [Ruminococcus sp.]|nr:hypothetical protein [Ruminococcus sp.]